MSVQKLSEQMLMLLHNMVIDCQWNDAGAGADADLTKSLLLTTFG